ncbi:chalcone isomerase [Tanacetum coccineum]
MRADRRSFWVARFLMATLSLDCDVARFSLFTVTVSTRFERFSAMAAKDSNKEGAYCFGGIERRLIIRNHANGVRHMEMQGTIQKVAVAGLYLEEKAIESLGMKWKGKTNVELIDSDEFYNEIFNGPFEKLIHVTLLIPVTGKFFFELAVKKMTALWKEEGTYNDEDAETIVKYLDVFNDEFIKPHDAVLYTILPDGSATHNIAKDGIVPEAPIGVIENKKWGPTQVDGMIGKNGVFPEVRQSVASRLSELFS